MKYLSCKNLVIFIQRFKSICFFNLMEENGKCLNSSESVCLCLKIKSESLQQSVFLFLKDFQFRRSKQCERNVIGTTDGIFLDKEQYLSSQSTYSKCY